MSLYISGHNLATLKKFRKTDATPRKRNCVTPKKCPLNGECLTQASVYQGTIEVPTEEGYRYIGISETTIKGRWSAHMISCKNRKYKNKSKLSQEFRNIRDSDHQIDRHENVKFKILKKVYPIKPVGKSITCASGKKC